MSQDVVSFVKLIYFCMCRAILQDSDVQCFQNTGNNARFERRKTRVDRLESRYINSWYYKVKCIGGKKKNSFS